MQKVKSRFTLKTAREMKRYTQEEAAKLIGVSVDTLGNYERGKVIQMFQCYERSKRSMVFLMNSLFFYL